MVKKIEMLLFWNQIKIPHNCLSLQQDKNKSNATKHTTSLSTVSPLSPLFSSEKNTQQNKYPQQNTPKQTKNQQFLMKSSDTTYH